MNFARQQEDEYEHEDHGEHDGDDEHAQQQQQEDDDDEGQEEEGGEQTLEARQHQQFLTPGVRQLESDIYQAAQQGEWTIMTLRKSTDDAPYNPLLIVYISRPTDRARTAALQDIRDIEYMWMDSEGRIVDNGTFDWHILVRAGGIANIVSIDFGLPQNLDQDIVLSVRSYGNRRE